MECFEDLWNLLDEYQFQIDNQIKAHVTCIFCNKILNNAYYGQCGCSFCGRCVTNYIKNGGKKCPGNGVVCTSENMFLENNIIKDPTANMRVWRLNVKCPLDSCSYHCKLGEMRDHLRLCNKKLLKCPFSELGCGSKAMVNEKLLDHLSTEVFQHNKLMIEMISNMRNEVTNVVDSYQHGGSLTTSNETSIEELNAVKSNVNALERMIEEMKENRDQELLELKKEITRLKYEEENHKKKIIRLENAMKMENKASAHVIIPPELITSKCLVLQPVSAVVQTPLASLMWEIKNVPGKRYNQNWIYSDPFFSYDGRYSICLAVAGGGCRQCVGPIGTHLCIGVTVSEASKSGTSHWPLKCHITITFRYTMGLYSRNKMEGKQCIFIKAGCEYFHFTYQDLVKCELINDNSLLTECNIETL